MALPVTPPYVFGNVTSSIPLTNLDADFATIYAAVNGIGNGTVSLANVSITGGTISNVSEIATSYVATQVISTSSNIGAYSYGTLSYSDVNIFESFTASANTYVQNILQNTNAGTAASADYVVSNNLGTATTYYGDFGMNGSGWTGTAGTNSFNAPNMVYLTSTTGDLLLGTTTANPIRFATNGGADAMYIDTSGNVGIGTSSPTLKLSIGIAAGTGGINHIYTGAGGPYSVANFTSNLNTGEVQIGGVRTNYFPTFYSSGSEAMRIDSSGNLLLGTTSNSTAKKLCVNGSVGFNDASGQINSVNWVQNKGAGATNSGGFGLSYTTVNYTPSSLPNALYWDGNTGYLTILTSSKQFKRNITSVKDSQLDKALQLKPSYYQRLEYDYWEYGFIAEQAKEIGLDELVTYHDGKVTGFDYNKVGVFAMGLIQRQEKAIQEQQALIENLTTRLTALEGK